MEQRQEEQGGDQNVGKQGNDVGCLQERRAQHFRHESIENQWLRLKVRIAHHGRFGAIAETIVKCEEGGAEGRAGDVDVSKHRPDAGDEQENEDGDADDAARAEGDGGVDDVAKRHPHRHPMGECQQREENAGDHGRDHGETTLGRGFGGAVGKIQAAGKQQQHEHLRQTAERVVPKNLAKQHQDRADTRNFRIEDA